MDFKVDCSTEPNTRAAPPPSASTISVVGTAGGVGAGAHIDSQECNVRSKFLSEIGQFGRFNPTGGARSVPEVHECRTVNVAGRDGVAVEGFPGKFDGFGTFIHGEFHDRSVAG